MIARTLWSRSASSIAARTSRSITAVQAFSLSGRFNVIVATRSATLYSVSSFGIADAIIYNGARVSHFQLILAIVISQLRPLPPSLDEASNARLHAFRGKSRKQNLLG